MSSEQGGPTVTVVIGGWNMGIAVGWGEDKLDRTAAQVEALLLGEIRKFDPERPQKQPPLNALFHMDAGNHSAGLPKPERQTWERILGARVPDNYQKVNEASYGIEYDRGLMTLSYKLEKV